MRAATFPTTRRSWPYAKDSPEDSVGDYRGVLYPRILGGIRCWETRGEARRLFDSTLKPSIFDYLRQNTSKIHESDSFLSLTLFMVGKRPDQAKPVVMFIADDKAARKEAFDLVKESGIMSSYPGFELGHTDLGKVMALAGEAVSVFADAKNAKCIRLFSKRPSPGTTPRSAAGGGIIVWKGMRMLLTVNHFLEDAEPTAPSSDPDGDDCEITGLEDFEDDGLGPNPRLAEVDATSRGSVSEPSENGSSEEEPLACFSERPVDGFPVPPSLLPAPLSGTRHMKAGELLYRSKDLDYALIKLSNSSNILTGFNLGTPVDLDQIPCEVELSPQDTPVTTITPNGECIDGRLSPYVHHIRLPQSQGFVEAYTAKFSRPLSPGDCGSWVRNARNGKFFGHAIAGDPTDGRALIMPAHLVLYHAKSSIRRLRPVLRTNTSVLLSARLWEPFKDPAIGSLLFGGLSALLSLVLSIWHCLFYANLNGTIVGSSLENDNTVRTSIVLAFLAQIFFVPIMGVVHRHCLLSLGPLEKTLGSHISAEPPIATFTRLCMSHVFDHSWEIALIVWTLVLSALMPISTSGALFIYDSTHQASTSMLVPYPSIANSSQGHLFSFSPPADDWNGATRIFRGPKHITSLLATATASQGDILYLSGPSSNCNYTLNFFGPSIQCIPADNTTRAAIDSLLGQEMAKSEVGWAREIYKAYHAFIPSFNEENAVILNAFETTSSELWITFKRYKSEANETCEHENIYQVCSLWNSTYNLNLAWNDGRQDITGTRDLTHRVFYPPIDPPGAITEMSRHAYNAYFQALANQVVGWCSWYETISSGPCDKSHFGQIRSAISDNLLLGSSDLDVFFGYSQGHKNCKTLYDALSTQRRQDIDLARNRALPELIEELSFNLTVSLMHDRLMTNSTERMVTESSSILRYGYNPILLWVPYGIACSYALFLAIISVAQLRKYRSRPSTTFRDILDKDLDSYDRGFGLHQRVPPGQFHLSKT